MALMESAAQPRRALRRDPERRLIFGVCAGIGRYFGVDPWLIRIGFIIATAAGGFGALIYLVCLVVMPGEAGRGSARQRRAGRASIEVGAGAGLLLLSLLLTLRALGIWFSDAVVWPLVLVAAGAALLWRQSAAAVAEPDATKTSGPAPEPARKQPRGALISRTGLGVALVIAAGVGFLPTTRAPSA